MATLKSIFKNVDEDRTIENAKRVLSDYRKWVLRARRVSFSLQSPTMDGMPKSPSYGNHIEEKHVNKLDAEFMASLVTNVIAAIEVDEGTAVYSKLLELKYIKRYTNVKCARLLDNLPDRTFDKYHRQALLMFAEVYPDAVEDLIVHKYKPVKTPEIEWS